MKFRRIISAALVFAVMLSCLVTLNVGAAAKTSRDGLWKYIVLEDGTLSLTSGVMYEKAYLGSDTAVTVPVSIDGKSVSEVGDYAFYKITTLQSVTIPSNILTIADGSFEGCTALKTLTIRDGVKIIGTGAFQNCSKLNTVTLPDSVLQIATNAFTGTAFYNNSSNWMDGGLYISKHLIRVTSSVTTFSIKDGTLTVALGAFSGCAKLTTVNLPASLKRIYWNSIGALAKFNAINADSANKYYCSVDGVLYSKDMTQLIIYPSAKADTSYTIPDGVKSIENSAMRGNTKLQEVIAPDSLESVGIYAFTGDTALNTVSFGDNIRYIGNGAFLQTAFYTNSENWENNVLYAGRYLIKSENTDKQYEIKDGTLLIAGSAFSGKTALEKITIPDSVRTISDFAFYYCRALKEVTLPDSVTSLGNSCFESCTGLEKITIPASVEKIGSLAFNHDSALSIYGDPDTYAEDYAYENNIPFVSSDGYKGFPDVKKGSWYYSAVKYCAMKGFIGGYSNGNFGPADNLKRQDFVMILARIADADLAQYENNASPFSDVKKGAYYYSAVIWAVENGIIGGYSNGKFGVGDNITREQVATILYRYMGSPDVQNVDKTLAKFSDTNRISAYAKTPLAWVVQSGIISGMADGRIAPVEGASRAQIATIVMRMDEQGMFNKT